MQGGWPQGLSVGQPSAIHLVYRHGDVDDTAGRVYDRLIARYGPAAVARDLFRQADELPPESAAAAFLASQMDRMAAQVILIGPRWLQGIERERDIQRVQVAAALHRQLPIIPMLAEGATMPVGGQLPSEVASLALFNASALRVDPDFDDDMRRLLATIDQYAPAMAAQAAAAPGASRGAGPRQPHVRVTPLRLTAAGVIGAALLFLLVAILVTVSGVGAASPQALSATPAPTATFLPTPFAPGYYFSPMTNGMPDWLLGSQCQAKPDGLHVVDSDKSCDAPLDADAGDGDLEVTARQISGDINLPYGVKFRSAFFIDQFYALFVTSGGYWTAYKQFYTDSGAFESNAIVPWSASSAIHTGLGASNIIEVRFKGTHFVFLINGQQVGSADDSSIAVTGTANNPGPNDGHGVFGHSGAEIVFIDYRLQAVGG